MERTNTAKWLENQKRWQLKVQKDCVRRSFTSSEPGRKGQRECNAKADEWLNDSVVNTSARVGDIYAEYLQSIKSNISESSSHYLKTESIGRNWILPAVGNLKISMLSDQRLQDIINKAYKANLAKKTLENIRATIMSFIKYCLKAKYSTLYTTLVYQELAIPKGAAVGERRILQPADMAKLFKCSKTYLRDKEVEDEFVNGYRFQALVGVRPGELMGLEWEDIENDVVTIRRSINALNETTSGKNKNATRRFALNSITKSIIESQSRSKGTNRVFGDMTLALYSKRWRRFCEYNSIPYVSLYELRHTFISIAKNLPEGELKALVGHSKSMDTLGVYGHEVQGELEKTALILNPH